MKAIILAACFTLCLCLVGGTRRATAQDGQQQPSETFVERQPKSEKFGALAYMPSGAGRAMIGPGATANVDLYVKSYTSNEEARRMAGLLVDGVGRAAQGVGEGRLHRQDHAHGARRLLRPEAHTLAQHA
jgi:hypothetical protein